MTFQLRAIAEIIRSEHGYQAATHFFIGEIKEIGVTSFVVALDS